MYRYRAIVIKMTSFNQLLTELIDEYKKMTSLTVNISLEKVIDPTRRPGSGWKTAISIQVALQFAQKDILILVGSTTTGYYYR